MKFRISSFTLALLLLAGFTTGCIDHAYDLDHVDRGAHFGSGDFTLPLGSTDKITIDQLIGNQFDELITRNSNGTYSISYGSDPYDLSFAIPQSIDRTLGLKKYKGRYIDVEFSAFSKPSSSQVQFDENGVADLSKRLTTRKLPARAFRLPFSIPNIPSQLNGLSGLTLTDDSAVRITISVPNCLLTDGAVIPDLNFDLHELFEVEGFPEGVITFKDLKLTSANNFSASKDLKLTKVVVAEDAFNQKTRTIDINAHLNFTGNILFENPKTTRARYQAAPSSNQLVVRVQLVNVVCQGIEGMFVYEVDSIRTRLKMSKIAEKFGGDDAPVSFTSPELRLTYSGNFSVPARATATFVAQRNGETTAQVKNVPFDLPVASGNKTAKRVYRFSSGGASTSGTVGVKADIPKLFKPIPDIIYVYLDVNTISTKTGVLELDKKYEMELSLSISSPIAFGPGLRLEYADTISIPDVLGKVLKQNELKLIGDIENTSPLKMDINLVMTDAAGNAVTVPAKQFVAAGGKSDIDLSFLPAPGASVENVSKLILQLQAAPATSGKAVKATDYVQTNLLFQIPGGYNFNF